MSNPFSRYKFFYDKAPKLNLASTFPIHVFLRAPNFRAQGKMRPADRQVFKMLANNFRMSCFESTFVHLTERFNKRDVFLVGTSNASTLLAQRTKKLIEQVEPDTVFVQTSEEQRISWWNVARLLQFVDSQEQLNHYQKELAKTIEYDFNNNSRKLPFKVRMFLTKLIVQMTYTSYIGYNLFSEWNPLQPGLQIKFACESAQKVGAALEFLGPELNQTTWNRLYHQTRYNLFKSVKQSLTDNLYGFYGDQFKAMRDRVHKDGVASFTQTCLDPYAINWHIQTLNRCLPLIKRTIIDKKDPQLFEAIDRSKGKRIVAVVNQFHMEGIEHMWAHRYGQLPRSVQYQEPISPIGDFPLKQALWNQFYNALQRSINSSNSKSTPSTWGNNIDTYNSEPYFQYEHRDM